jgi:hypothetical protein
MESLARFASGMDVRKESIDIMLTCAVGVRVDLFVADHLAVSH